MAEFNIALSPGKYTKEYEIPAICHICGHSIDTLHVLSIRHSPDNSRDTYSWWRSSLLRRSLAA